jgi:hypothetical protein
MGTEIEQGKIYSNAHGLAGLIVVSERVCATICQKILMRGKSRHIMDLTHQSSKIGRQSLTSAWTACQPSSHEVNMRMLLIDVYCAELTYHLGAAKSRAPPIIWLKGHKYTSTIAHINTLEDILGKAVRELIWRPY